MPTTSTSQKVSAMAVNKIKKSRNDVSPAEARLRFPTGEFLNYGIMFKFVKYSYDVSNAKAKFTNSIQGPHIFLPIATNLSENLNIHYQDVDLGAAGILFQKGYQTANSVAGGITGANKMSDQSVNDKNAGQYAAGEALNTATYVARRLISDINAETGASINLATGTVPNPYTIATFQNIGLRSFNLTFRLIPQSEADSIMIQRIVNQFKYHSLPSREGLFLKMPEELEIVFYGTDFLFRFARCVLTSVSVNYNAYGAPSFFNNGAPTGVELTLGIQEIEQITKESYGDTNVNETPAAQVH